MNIQTFFDDLDSVENYGGFAEAASLIGKITSFKEKPVKPQKP